MSIFYTIKSTIGTDNPIYTDNDSPFYFTPLFVPIVSKKSLILRFTTTVHGSQEKKKNYLVTAYAHIE